MVEIKHFLHLHNLSPIQVEEEDDSVECPMCGEIIHGPAYYCKICVDANKFFMHKSCAELSFLIQRDALHPHPLRFTLSANLCVCDGCGRLSMAGFIYKCIHCVFNLDIRCAIAFSNDDELFIHQTLQEVRQIKTTIHHFSHNHPLTRGKLHDPEGRECMACKQELQGTLVYACIPCAFFLHESCINGMSRQVQSPFHPQHILLLRPLRRDFFHVCDACEEDVEGICFYCNQCHVALHLSCAMYRTRAMKHICHPHPLLYLGKTIGAKIPCHECFRKDNRDSLRCTTCDFRIHVECISLPARVEHPRHLHPLVLINYFIEDDSGDYCCEICETERNPGHCVYYCQECSFVAHIDCVILEFEHTAEMFMDQLQIEEKSNNSLESEMMSVDDGKMIQNDFFHPHPLILNDEVAEAMFVCNGCGELGRGSSYDCNLCSFSLDAKCAALKLGDDVAKHEAEKAKTIKTTISHFSHVHQLTHCKINEALQTELSGEYCKACRHGIGDLMYVCLFCRIFFHESCLMDMPMQVQSPFHPHLLFPYVLDSSSRPSCHVCRDNVEAIGLICFHCEIGMHFSCAVYQTREMKHDRHAHSLQHFRTNIFADQSPKCNACGAYCRDTFFCCLNCKLYIHLNCIPLPYIVKHVRHSHPLTLTKSVVEDDSGNYYCDTCETKRNPELDVYYCKECNYIAHIDCVLSEIEPPEDILEYLVPYRRNYPW